MDTSVSTPQAVATVISVEGQAFARTPAGQMRALKAGDVIREGETIVTTANGQVQLAFVDGHILTVLSSETYHFSAETSSNTRPSTAEASLAAGDIERVIQALERGENIDDVLDPTAAGVDGAGENGGNSFVRLMRIVEGVETGEIPFGTGGVRVGSPEQDFDEPATLSALTPVNGTVDTTAPTISISTVAGDDVINDSEDDSVTLSGTTTGVEDGQSVTVVIRDASSAVVFSGSATVSSNAWSIAAIDLSALADGANYTVTADVTDAAGNAATQATRSISTVDTTAPTLSAQSFAYNENQLAGATVATLVAGDNVAVTNFTFTATGTQTSADGYYQINNSGVITLTAAGAASSVNNFEQGTNSGVYSVTAHDAAGNTSSANITLSELNLNDNAPTTSPVTLTAIAEDSGARLITQAQLLGNANDADGNSLTATGLVINPGSQGLLVDNGNGTWWYTPASNDESSVNFDYSITDGTYSVAGTATLDITPVNDAPTAVADTASVIEDATVTRTAVDGVLSNDTDPDNPDTKTVTEVGKGILLGPEYVSNPLSGFYGTLTLNADGSYNYIADLPYAQSLIQDEVVSDSFVYTMRDTVGLTSQGTLTFTITGTNDAPVASADSLAATEDTSVTYTAPQLLGNDSDAELLYNNPYGQPDLVVGNALTIASVTNGSGGTVVLNGDGTVTFTPTANFNGPATFSYIASDGITTSNSATVTVNVTAVNDAPVNTVPGAQSTNEDTARVFSVANGNAITVADVDGGTLTTTVSVTNGTLTAVAFAGATITANGTGSVTISGTAAAINGALNGLSYANTADYNGSATLTVVTSDGSLSDSDSIAITVTPVADIVADVATTTEDNAVTINVLGNDSFENGARTITAVNGSAITDGGGSIAVTNGSVALVGGQLIFTPTANFNGVVPTFTYTVTSGGVTETANVNVTVTAVNDAPVNAVPGAQTTAEDTTKAITGLSISDVDAGGASMTVTLAVTNGTLTVSGGSAAISGSGTNSVTLTGTAAAINTTLAATVNYVPTVNFNGTATLTMTTSDNGNTGSGGTLTDVDTVSITVTAVNDLPTGTDNTLTTNEDTAYTFSAASFGYSDVEGSALASVRIDSLPAAGTLLLSGVPVTAGQVITAANLGNLTFAPVANANGTGYASFTFSVNDGTGFDATPNSITLNVSAVADTPELFTPSQLNALVAGVSTASATASVSKANLAGAIGLPSATLDSFDPPPGPGTNDPGTVNVNDGGLTNYNYTLASGMSVVFDWTFTNLETQVADINNGFNDIVVLVVTNPDGTQTSMLITSSEQAGAGTNTSGTYNFTAATAGSYQFSWLALNGIDTQFDSSIAISNIAFQLGASTFGTPVEFPISTALVDTDGSETLAVTVAGVPAGAAFSAGTNLGGGSWSFTAAQLPGLIFLPADGYSGTVNLTVTATTTETSNGSIASTTQTVAVTVTETTNTMTGTNGNNTLTGTVNNDHIQGLSGNDTLSGGAGNDLIFGGAGSDTLNGNDGNDRLSGGAGTDILNGGNGNDTLIGGSGNDTLTGGIGSDVFRWELADQGAAGTPAMDTITDFDIALPAAGGDILDLRDLLVGESHSGSSPGTLDDYLHFEISGSNTIVHISTSGGFSSGFNAALDDQQITLTGVDLVTGFANDNAIITDLLTKNKLITD